MPLAGSTRTVRGGSFGGGGPGLWGPLKGTQGTLEKGCRGSSMDLGLRALGFEGRFEAGVSQNYIRIHGVI